MPSDRDNRWASPAIVAVSVDAARTSRSRGESGFVPSARASSASAGSTTRPPAATRRIASASWAAGASLRRNPERAGLHRPAEVARPPEGRHDDRPTARQGGPELGSGAEAVESRHLDVEQGDVGADLEGRGHDLVAAGDVRDDLEIKLEAQQRDDRAADERLVLGDEDPDHAMGTET